MDAVTTTLLLIRHAAHDHLGRILSGRLPGIPLSEAGALQAAALAARLAAIPLAAIATSPVRRARQTAAAIAAGRGGRVTIAEALDEVDFGAWAGMRFDALAGDPAWDAWNGRRGTAPTPGGETMAAAQARILRFADEAAAAHPGGTVALVSHCDMIRAALCGWLGLPLDRILRFDVDPASVSRVAIGPGGARVLSINEGGA